MRMHDSKKIPQMYLPVLAQVRIQAPHVFSQRLIEEREKHIHLFNINFWTPPKTPHFLLSEGVDPSRISDAFWTFLFSQ